jgi:RNA polymerase sigma-70 factor (ECF subfamily)
MGDLVRDRPGRQPQSEGAPTSGHPDTVIEACRRGERAALEQVFRAEVPALERLLERLAGPGADLEDLVQQTLLEAVGAFRRFRGEALVRTWLAHIAVNVFHQSLRRPERRQSRVSLELVRPEQDSLDCSAWPDRRTEGRRKLERLYGHLDSIAPLRRIPFILHVIEGHTIEEVAALVGASVMATKSRIFWARRTLLARVRQDAELRDLVVEKE